MKLFSSINDFLTMCVDYLELRVRTGKFVGDIDNLEHELREKAHKKREQLKVGLKTSKTLMKFNELRERYWKLLLKIPVIGDIALVFFGTIRLLLLFPLEYAMTLAITCLTFIILFQHFQTSAFMFTTMLLPIFWVNALLNTLLFFIIDTKEHHLRVTVISGAKQIFKSLSSIIILVSLHVFTLFSLIMFFFLSAFTISLVFQALHIVWESSVLYWYIVCPLGILTIIATLIFNLVAFQAYFLVVLDRQTPFHAIRNGWRIFKLFPFQLTFYQLLLILVTILLSTPTYKTYYYFGVALLLFGSGQVMMMMSYLLRRKILKSTTADDGKERAQEHGGFLALFVVGSLTFILTSILFAREYPTLQAYMQKTQEQTEIEAQLTPYENARYHYTIKYPKTWSIYQFENNPDIPTIYNNYNGNEEGGIWIKVMVTDKETSQYDTIKSSKPGLVSYDPETQTILTKVSDITFQEIYSGVKYTYSIPQKPNPQYQTHYLIEKGDVIFDIVFITVSKIAEDDNSRLFENIIGSFHFTE